MDSPRSDVNQHLKLGDHPEGFAASTDCILVVEGTELRVHSQVTCNPPKSLCSTVLAPRSGLLLMTHRKLLHPVVRASLLHTPRAACCAPLWFMSASAADLPCKTERFFG